jgi:hypothetical protein
VLFLWTSKSGLTQIIGLSQGAFDVQTNKTSGETVVSRAAVTEQMLDAQGNVVRDRGVVIGLSDLRRSVANGGTR